MAANVHIRFRSQQVSYLARKAALDETSLSRAFGDVLERYATALSSSAGSPKKARACLCIRPEHLAVLDRLAVQAGVSRSDMARRLVDTAIVEHPTLVIAPGVSW